MTGLLQPREQLDDQLYQATPTKQNIEDAREQFGLSREELSDDEVSEYIVQTKVGMPVLNSPGQVAASNKAIAMRMQNKPTGKFFKGLDRPLAVFREGEWGDSLIAFWRSPDQWHRVGLGAWDCTLCLRHTERSRWPVTWSRARKFLWTCWSKRRPPQ